MYQRIASITGLSAKAVQGTVKLLDEGNTVPFIARYRKEATAGLTEEDIRTVQETSKRLNELVKRRESILETIEEQGKLTADLRRRVEGCWDRQELEDLYLPYKPKKSTKAQKARDLGLEPLAHMMLGQKPLTGTVRQAAEAFVTPGKVADWKEALAGARDIVAEEVANAPEVRGRVREMARRSAQLVSRKKRGVKDPDPQYRDYFEFQQRLGSVPAHRFMALQRGEKDGVLSLSLDLAEGRILGTLRAPFERRVPAVFLAEFELATEDSMKRLLWPAISRELLAEKKEEADRASVQVFARNLEALLMEPPRRGHVVMAVDPGFRHGCKCALVDATGRVLDIATIYPNAPQNRTDEARRVLLGLARKHGSDVIGVGDGTAHRETMRFLKESGFPEGTQILSVSEAGASVYSASPLGVQEFPDMDVSVRGAVSIARRFQDPLAELVKIEPQHLGVGQYQHDVDGKLLEESLDAVVEDCVNRVGVELNTASAPLLARVAGIGPKAAGAIVSYRDSSGAFGARSALLKVPGIGPARFEQCAGFLRIREGSEPLDATGVHPERYPWLKKAVRKAGVSLVEVLGNEDGVKALEEVTRGDETVGDATRKDIWKELARPGHDPRGAHEQVAFADGVESIEDLREGMVLEGRVNSITDFGAFVDIGVHRDGLVHVSAMADRRVNSPFDVCRPQQVVRVVVVEIDRSRNRIGLSMKPSDFPGN